MGLWSLLRVVDNKIRVAHTIPPAAIKEPAIPRPQKGMPSDHVRGATKSERIAPKTALKSVAVKANTVVQRACGGRRYEFKGISCEFVAVPDRG